MTTKTPSLAELKRTGKVHNGPCPACGYKSGLSVRYEGGRLLALCHVNHCRFRDILAALGEPTKPFNRLPKQKQNYSAKREYAFQLWNEAVDIKDSPAETYLAKRGICFYPPNDCLRYHTACWHTPSEANHSCLLSKVTHAEDGRFMAIQRIYLDDEGNKYQNSAVAKMQLGSITGGVVRLGERTGCLMVCEGLETGLTLYQETGMETWCVLPAVNFNGITVTAVSSYQKVTFCADNDVVGLQAANQSALRLENAGVNTSVSCPPKIGTDFNDVLTGGTPWTHP